MSPEQSKRLEEIRHSFVNGGLNRGPHELHELLTMVDTLVLELAESERQRKAETMAFTDVLQELRRVSMNHSECVRDLKMTNQPTPAQQRLEEIVKWSSDLWVNGPTDGENIAMVAVNHLRELMHDVIPQLIQDYQPRWHKWPEEKPTDDDIHYLIRNPDGHITYGLYDGHGEYPPWCDEHDFGEVIITHWMDLRDLPPPPNTEETKEQAK